MTYLSTNPIFHARTKYVEVDYHFIWDRIMKKEIQIYFISSQDQLVYVFTKSLLIASFTAFLLQASGRSSTQGLRGHIIGYIYIGTTIVL
jgi:hypothetical protein